ncbi:uncharacterized protein DUF4397 [Chitinophaga niastensis]|uniref:Uncharacterized protein DUF4397 n=1 Tax=Chitinophaga niastensis TaxID=536980 RepID=A0A2P8HMR7_CHINA|nr:DUF4397 domain-containing protein [Chitinophaga niastensis]PSL47504.1 uncharacterized protein DUF4397 [Chitinophaga niastensis]
MKQLILPVIIVLALLAACKKNSDSSIPVTQSNFMFFNAVPGNAQFNILLDSLPVATNVGYGVGTGYKQFRAQNYNLYIYDTRTPNNLMYGGQINLRNKRFYSAYLGADSTGLQLALRITEDDLSSPGAGTAKFRVVDLSQAFTPNRSVLGIDVYSDTFPRFFRGITFTALTPFATVYGDSNYTKLNFRWTDSTKVLQQYHLSTQAGKVYTLVTTRYPLDSLNFKIFTIQHN